jgi:NAD(P)-dependent dehydrogenase (short-subunit alcohol dehydrogenase family)
MHKLDGKVAVITGGTTGIGLATAKLFVEEGAFVFIVGRRKTELDAAVRALGDGCMGIQGDVANPNNLDHIYEIVRSARGRVDIVFANAGTLERAPLESITEEHFSRLMDTNVKGVLFTVQKALPLLRDGGCVVLTGSVAGSKGTVGQTVYGATKAALRSFVRTWAVELKDRRVRVNIVSPGPVATSPVVQQPADVIARMIATVPMGRMGEPEEISKAVLFLASDDAGFITGIELFVDGGRAQV